MTDQIAASQPPFLVRGRRRIDLVQSDTPWIRHAAKYRTKRLIGGMFREIEVSGVDRKHLDVTARNPRRSDGRKGGSNVSTQVEKSAAGLKTAVRRLRPEEAARLDEKDAEIAAALERVVALRAERSEIVREAWRRAHVVRLSEITLAPDPKPRPE